MEKKTITVTIFNEQYNLTTELPKKETEAIAEMVDKKMQQFAEKTHVVKTGRVAVWAALDFAGELYKLRKEYEKLLAQHTCELDETTWDRVPFGSITVDH